MAKSIQMIVVLAVIALISGLALGGLNELTYETAQNNILRFKKIPAVASIYEVVAGQLDPEARGAVEEQLLAEKKLLDLGEAEPLLLFVVQKENKPYAVAIENFGAGFAGPVGVMAGFHLETGNLVGIGITTMAETPGVGTRIMDESFTLQFRNMGKESVLKVKKDGGQIDAVTGATVSSRAVAQALDLARTFYLKHEAAIKQAVTE